MSSANEEENEPFFTDYEVFINIWLNPRQVFRFIQRTKYEKHLRVLFFLAGIAKAFDRATMKDFGDRMSIWMLIGVCVVGGGLMGWIGYYFYAGLLSWTGRWIKGRGDFPAMLRVLGYGMIPSIVALLFLIPQIGVYGIDLFRSDGDLASAGLIPSIIFYVALFFESILTIWTIRTIIIGTSEIQQLSNAKAVLNLLLPVIVLLVPIAVVAFIYQAFF